MDIIQEQFIDKYKQATEVEFNLFMAEANKHAYEKEKNQTQDVANNLDRAVSTYKQEFNQQKQELASIPLSPKQAKEIIQQNNQDNYTFDIDGIKGSDTYRFMNQGLKNNPEVANEAFKQDPKVARHFPHDLQERMEGHKPEKALPALAKASEITNSMNQRYQQKQKMAMAM